MRTVFNLGLACLIFGYTLLCYSFMVASINVLGVSELFIVLGAVVCLMNRKSANRS